MLLRVSGETTGQPVDARAVTDPTRAAASGIDHAELLVAFADALVAGDDEALVCARQALRARIGDDGLVDAAAVAANFERMVRIADATGIPLDQPVAALSTGLREELGIDAFGSAANTPRVGALVRGLGRAFGPVLLRLFSSGLRPHR